MDGIILSLFQEKLNFMSGDCILIIERDWAEEEAKRKHLICNMAAYAQQIRCCFFYRLQHLLCKIDSQGCAKQYHKACNHPIQCFGIAFWGDTSHVVQLFYNGVQPPKVSSNG